MVKQNVIRIVWFSLVVAWMVLIFALSAQESQVSSNLSGGVIDRLMRVFMSDFVKLPDAERVMLIDGLQNAVRKGAHAAAYFVLGALLTGAMHTFEALRTKIRLLAAFAVAVAYAASDELHQMFVPGRSCSIKDVLIDAIGAGAGIAAMVAILRIGEAFQGRKKMRRSQCS